MGTGTSQDARPGDRELAGHSVGRMVTGRWKPGPFGIRLLSRGCGR